MQIGYQKGKLAKVLSARHGEKRRILCQKMSSHIEKKAGNWKLEESPHLPEQAVRRREPLPLPKPLPEQEWREERRKLPHLWCAEYFQGSLPVPRQAGSCWQKSVFPSEGAEGNFEMKSWEPATPSSPWTRLLLGYLIPSPSRVFSVKARIWGWGWGGVSESFRLVKDFWEMDKCPFQILMMAMRTRIQEEWIESLIIFLYINRALCGYFTSRSAQTGEWELTCYSALMKNHVQ